MSLELDRERTIQALCAHYARDHLTTQELELRFERAYRAASPGELQALTQELPALPAAAAVPTPGTTPGLMAGLPPMYAVAAPAAAVPEKRYLALMSEVRRQGMWSVPSRIRAAAWMGAIRLDLRESEIPAEGVDIEATAMMGEVRIILPPGLRVEVDGTAIMGEFSDRTSGGADRAAPAVRVHGSAFMGAVRVETRLPHPSVLELWRHRGHRM